MSIERKHQRPLMRFGGKPEELDLMEDKSCWLVYHALEKGLAKAGIVLDKNTKLLEVGSGNGNMLQFLLSKGINATGVDLHPRSGKGLPEVSAHLEQLPFGDNSFDVVFSGSVFDDGVYVQDQAQMFREIVRVLRPGGAYYGWAERIQTVPEGVEAIAHADGIDPKVYKKA